MKKSREKGIEKKRKTQTGVSRASGQLSALVVADVVNETGGRVDRIDWQLEVNPLSMKAEVERSLACFHMWDAECCCVNDLESLAGSLYTIFERSMRSAMNGCWGHLLSLHQLELQAYSIYLYLIVFSLSFSCTVLMMDITMQLR